MMLFFGGEIKTAIPESRVFKMMLVGKELTVFYNSGDISWIDDNTTVPQLGDITVRYDTEELAVQNFRDYFAACEKKKGAFYFG